MKTYRLYEPDQLFLIPLSLKEWLPENDLAYFVSDIVEQMKLTAIEAVYEKEERGYPPYHPVMMVKVLLWARKKYKRLARHGGNARRHLGRVCKRTPGLFEHWKLGLGSPAE